MAERNLGVVACVIERMKRYLLSVIVAFAVGFPIAAHAAPLVGDPVHSSARFGITHLAISHVQGRIPITAWSATVNAAGMPSALKATLDVSKVDTHEPDRDKDLRSPNFFDAATYPTMTFVATSIKATDATHFVAVGNLTLHGVTMPVTLTGEVLGGVTDPWGHKRFGYTASTTINRQDFGMTWGKTLPGGQLIVGNDVTITINAEGIIPK